MSDWGISSAIEQSNNLISEGLSSARETREHNRSVVASYNQQISNITNQKTAGVLPTKAGDEGAEGLAGIQTAVAVGRELKSARTMGLGNYLASQPGQTAENIRSAINTGKSALGLGTSSARDALIAGGQGAVMNNVGNLSQEGESLGVLPGAIKKGLSAITDLPDKQVAGLAKGLGAFAGIAGAGFTGLEDIASGSFGGSEGKDATSTFKTANKASLVAGGLDAMALAVPVLAPVAGVADLVAGGLGIAGDISESSMKKQQAKTTEQSNLSTGTSNVVSEGSAGQIASASTQQRTY